MFTIENQKFGVELEFFGISSRMARQIIAEVFGTEVTGSEVQDNKNRVWKTVSDASVANDGFELVTPPLLFEDMPKLEEIVQKLKEAGASVDGSCGMHVHVDLSNYGIVALRNLVKYYAKYEDMFYNACEVIERRLRYCGKLKDKHQQLVEKIGTVTNLDELKELWYHDGDSSSDKYSPSRYVGLNLHNIWYRGWFSGTVEFRLFNGTMDHEVVRNNIILALSISAKALNSKAVNSRKNEKVEDKFLFSKILGGLGINAKNELTSSAYKQFTKPMRAVV